MTKWLRLSAVTFLMVSQVSCTSWLIRQECEKINWYDHAYTIAMQGKRMSGDATVDRCRKAEFDMPESKMDQGFKAGMSNYCKPEIVYATGKKGDFFNMDLCDPGQANPLRQRHAEGVKAYCAADNGFGAGASGRKYQNICPANLEKAFLKEYNRGRKKYLEAVVSDARNEVSLLDGKISTMERDKMFASQRLRLLPPVVQPGQKVYNSLTGQYEIANQEVDPSQGQRNDLNRQISNYSTQISQSRERQDQLRKTISDSQIEMAGLE